MGNSPLFQSTAYDDERACSWTIKAFMRHLTHHLKTSPSIQSDSYLSKRIKRICTHTDYVTEGVLFVPWVGERVDGHQFIKAALEKGAIMALTEHSPDSLRPALSKAQQQCCLHIDSTTGVLMTLAQAAREENTSATFIGITGSAGKTTTKDALHFVLQQLGHQAHKPRSSFNNHVGVPLTLLNQPVNAKYGVIEMGMNAPGEIDVLSKMTKPHIGLITTVGSAHQAAFPDLKGIAMEKASLFNHLKEEGAAILNHDMPYFREIKEKASRTAEHIISFGQNKGADICLTQTHLTSEQSEFTFRLSGQTYRSLIPRTGIHEVMNVLGIIGVCHALQLPIEETLKALKALPPVFQGRGTVLTLARNNTLGPLIILDGSYNANPLSMHSIVASLALWHPQKNGRRIAILGDMVELGKSTQEAHAHLKYLLSQYRINEVITVGELMKEYLVPLLSPNILLAHFETSAACAQHLPKLLRPCDVLAVKGSLSIRMATICEALVKLSKN